MYIKGRHEVHVLIVFRRKKPFDKKEESRIHGVLERVLQREFKANVQKLQVVIP